MDRRTELTVETQEARSEIDLLVQALPPRVER
jgi:hypothetical protein